MGHPPRGGLPAMQRDSPRPASPRFGRPPGRAGGVAPNQIGSPDIVGGTEPQEPLQSRHQHKRPGERLRFDCSNVRATFVREGAARGRPVSRSAHPAGMRKRVCVRPTLSTFVQGRTIRGADACGALMPHRSTANDADRGDRTPVVTGYSEHADRFRKRPGKQGRRGLTRRPDSRKAIPAGTLPLRGAHWRHVGTGFGFSHSGHCSRGHNARDRNNAGGTGTGKTGTGRRTGTIDRRSPHIARWRTDGPPLRRWRGGWR